ncbi:MAG: GspE/PulE family protein [bacterium]
MHVPEQQLTQFIIDSGLVSRKDVDNAHAEARERGRSVGDVLVLRGHLSEDDLRRTASYVLGIPFVQFAGKQIPPDILLLIPEPVARAHNVIALDADESGIEVALLDIDDLASLDALREKTGRAIRPRLTDTGSIRSALMQYQKALQKEFGAIISTESNLLDAAGLVEGASREEITRLAEDPSIARIVDALLRHAIVQNASDVHVEPAEGGTLVRYRIDGALHDAMSLPGNIAPRIIARIKLLAALDLHERRLPQDGRFRMETEKDTTSFRVSTLQTDRGEKLVLRLLRETAEGFTLETLGFHGEGLEHLHKALRERSGLILVAGPSGSGRTTTLYTLLDILNAPERSIATIEERVEYRMKRVSQTQVDVSAGFGFANGLRAILRQDPDVVMVGDIGDAETAALAISAALSGRLVLGAISAGSAAAAISRLIAVGADPSSLAASLKAVIAQRLARRLCDEKETYVLNTKERAPVAPEESFRAALGALQEERVAKSGVFLDTVPFPRAKPSAECMDGFKGYVGLQEILPVSSAIRDLIVREGTNEEIEGQAVREGMLMLFEDGLYKVMRGMTSLEEVAGTI